MEHISTLLDTSRIVSAPYPLVANKDKRFQGSVIVGMGFILKPEEAQELIEKDPHNKDVLFPYLNGQDLNSHPEQRPSRWLINFFDWPLKRGAEVKMGLHEKKKSSRKGAKFSLGV